jgi:predicted nucleotidyltransferase component of viral defense system
LRFEAVLDGYQGDGARFQKFAFADLGEIDFIVAGPLTEVPFTAHEIQGQTIQLETVSEIIAKKIYYRGVEAKPRDIFDLAAAASTQREAVVRALRAFPERVAMAKNRLDALNPEFVDRTIAQLMIKPGYATMVGDSLAIAKAVLDEVLRPS